MRKIIFILGLLILGSTILFAHGPFGTFSKEYIQTVQAIFVFIFLLPSVLILTNKWKNRVIRYIFIPLVIFLFLVEVNIFLEEKIDEKIERYIYEYKYKNKKDFLEKNLIKYKTKIEVKKNNITESLKLLASFEKALINKGILKNKSKTYYEFEEKYHEFVAKEMLYLAIFQDKKLIGYESIYEMSDSDYKEFYNKYKDKLIEEKYCINLLNQYRYLLKKHNSINIDQELGGILLVKFTEKGYKIATKMLLPMMDKNIRLTTKLYIEKVFLFDKNNKSHEFMQFYFNNIDYIGCSVGNLGRIYEALRNHPDFDLYFNLSHKNFMNQCKELEIRLSNYCSRSDCKLYMFAKKNPKYMDIYSTGDNMKKMDEHCVGYESDEKLKK